MIIFSSLKLFTVLLLLCQQEVNKTKWQIKEANNTKSHIKGLCHDNYFLAKFVQWTCTTFSLEIFIVTYRENRTNEPDIISCSRTKFCIKCLQNQQPFTEFRSHLQKNGYWHFIIVCERMLHSHAIFHSYRNFLCSEQLTTMKQFLSFYTLI